MSEPSMSPAIPIATVSRGTNHWGQHNTRIAEALFGMAVDDEVIS